MPTSFHAFARIAAKHGGVDPADTEAVQEWFLKVLPGLSPQQVERLLEELLEEDGPGRPPQPPPGSAYPSKVPLPRLEEAESARLPVLAGGVTALLRRLLGRGT